MINRRSILLSSLFFSVCASPFISAAQTIEPYPLVHKKSSLAKGRFASLAGKSKALDPRIGGILTNINAERIISSIDELQGFVTRRSLTQENSRAVDWLAREFETIGYDTGRVQLQEFRMPSGQALNSVLLMPEPDKSSFVVVCAHLDSIAHPPSPVAPGADDNASGVSMLLEIARVLLGTELQRGIMLIAFNGEEQGLIGSQECAKIATAEQWPIDLVINLDMIGFVSPAKPDTIIIEYDQGNKKPENDAVSRSFALQMAQATADYTALSVEHTNIWSSDYMPFEAAGYPCVGLYDEGGDAAFYHSSTDTIANVDKDRLNEVARLLIASLVSICGLANA